MPWPSLSPMDSKMRFIGDYTQEYFDFTELCSRYGISRKTGYKWVDRYEEFGPHGLYDRSRRPHLSPNQTSQEITQKILEIREKRIYWGGKKILKRLSKHFPQESLPVASTIARILDKNNCITKERRRPRRSHPGKPYSVPQESNELWAADFKGQFKTLDGRYCYPLTVSDTYSRYFLGCHAMLAPRMVESRAFFTRLFQERGLPKRIRTDNGLPFASTALGRLSQLSVWWIRLGIIPELIELGHPEQNGRHERIHRTLKQETTFPPEKNLKAQQERFDQFLMEYNEERPHESLDMETPDSVYQPSFVPMPDKLPPIEYPPHFQTRLVSNNGGIRWHHIRLPVSHVLIKEYIGFDPIDDGIWDVFFGPVWIGRFNERIGRIIDERGRLARRRKL